MRGMCKWMVAALLACSAFVCRAEGEDEIANNLVMYWMLDYSSKADTLVSAVNAQVPDSIPEKIDPGTGESSPYAAGDFHFGKLVAVIDGTKVVVGAAPLEGLKAGGATGDDRLMADVGFSLPSASSTVSSFWVELYNLREDGSLALLGWTESVTPDQLASLGALDDFRDPHKDIVNVGGVWSPTEFTAVPEPTSGLLLLIGGALLALRRRRRAEANVEC